VGDVNSLEGIHPQGGIYIWVVPNIRFPLKWMVKLMENLFELMIWGEHPQFSETSILPLKIGFLPPEGNIAFKKKSGASCCYKF